MSADEQQKLRERSYAEAMRYMDNAREILTKAGKEGKFYSDKKYVRTACGTAYNGVLIALDAYLELKDVEIPKKKRRSIEFYMKNIALLDKKLLKCIDVAYDTLHLSGYYDGNLSVRVITAGFDVADEIIEKVKPV
jgi:hypothetical protein